MLLMPFLTNALGVPAAAAGIVIFLPKIWVVFCDPMMGILSDRARLNGLPRAKIVGWAGFGMMITLPLLFAPILLPTPMLRATYVCVAYLVGSTVFSSFSVPYLSLASEVALDSRDRTRVLALRQSANFVGALLSNYAPALVQILGGGRTAYAGMGAIFGLVCFVMTLSVLRLKSLPNVIPPTKPTSGALSQFGLVLRDGQYRLLLSAYLMQMAGVGVISAAFIYFVVYRLGGDLVLVSVVATCMTVAGLLAQPLWVALEARFGAWSTYMLCISGMALSDASFFLLNADHRNWVYLVGACVGVFSSGFSVMAWTLLLNFMAEAEARGGAQQGAYAGLWSAGEKIAMAAGALLGGTALQMAGFVPSIDGFTTQSPSAILGIRLTTAGLTSGLLTLSLLILLRLRLRLKKTAVMIPAD
jgi:GPH family glycoside/pentoside/hexuronide:cation symporter